LKFPLSRGLGGCKKASMTTNKIIPYNQKLKEFARQLRKNSTLSEVLLWNNIKNKSLRFEFHRQVPLDEFIVDFFCHKLLLAIEIDGNIHDYNFDYDNYRQIILEKYGVTVLRFSDIEVKKNMNDVLRSMENVISDLEVKFGLTSPLPPFKGGIGN
jgi:very-short-patch-repair endonuclease